MTYDIHRWGVLAGQGFHRWPILSSLPKDPDTLTSSTLLMSKFYMEHYLKLQHQEAFYSCTCHLVDLTPINQSANRGLDVEHLGMDSRFRRRLWRHKLLPHRKGGAVFATATAAALIESSWTPKGERGWKEGKGYHVSARITALIRDCFCL